jgi:hypothetical protein
MSNMKLPPYSKTAHHAAFMEKSDMAVVITLNDAGQCEHRCYGANERLRLVAGKVAEASIKAIRTIPPLQNDVAFKALSAEPDHGGQA